MTPLAISAYTLTTALGASRAATLDALRAERSGLAPARFLDVELPTWIGEVAGLANLPLPADLADHDCRNNRLAWLGLQQDGFAEAVLARVRKAVKPGGVLLLRVGNASKKRRFALGQWIDRVSMALRGGGFIPLAGRPPEQWSETLRGLGFDVELVPMNGRPPFSNFLLVARVPADAAA